MARWSKHVLSLLAGVAALPCAAVAQSTNPQAGTTASATLRADKPGSRINRDVFGQFAEHLGSGI